MSSSSTPQLERDTSILAVGKQCSDPGCLLVDFLPFQCQHCKHSFCQEHFKVDAHKCPQYDESKHNRVAPDCPLCNMPVAVRLGQDPNVRMDEHLERECSVVTGKVKAKTTPVCARATCKKVLFSPIRCTSCRQQFCPAHRFPGDHSCANAEAATPMKASNSAGSYQASMASLNVGAKNLNARALSAGNAALEAVKTKTAVAAASVSAASKGGSSTPKPFRGVDRRAKAERESRLKAMRERAKKGLLREEEKAILAAEEAADRERKGDCVIM